MNYLQTLPSAYHFDCVKSMYCFPEDKKKRLKKGFDRCRFVSFWQLGECMTCP